MQFKDTVILVNRPEKHFVTSFYYKHIRAGIDAALDGTNYQLFVAQQDNHFVDVLSSKKSKVAGVIAIAPHIADESVKILESEQVPAMLINCRSNKANWIDLDNMCASIHMTEHLIKLGHERILFIGGFLESQNSIDRLKGFQKALDKYRIKYDPRLMITCDFSITLAYDRMKEFLQHNQKSFTAIFAANDLMAVGAVRALVDEGIKVPEDVAVVGFDDFEFASTFYVPLTTYRQPFENLGFVAARAISSQIESGIPSVQRVELIGQIIVRKSCGSAQISR